MNPSPPTKLTQSNPISPYFTIPPPFPQSPPPVPRYFFCQRTRCGTSCSNGMSWNPSIPPPKPPPPGGKKQNAGVRLYRGSKQAYYLGQEVFAESWQRARTPIHTRRQKASSFKLPTTYHTYCSGGIYPQPFPPSLRWFEGACRSLISTRESEKKNPPPGDTYLTRTTRPTCPHLFPPSWGFNSLDIRTVWAWLTEELFSPSYHTHLQFFFIRIYRPRGASKSLTLERKIHTPALWMTCSLGTSLLTTVPSLLGPGLTSAIWLFPPSHPFPPPLPPFF